MRLPKFLERWVFRKRAKAWMQQSRPERLHQFQALVESMTIEELRVWSIFPNGPALLAAARKDPKMFGGKFYRPEAIE